MRDRFFADTSWMQALLSPRDELHARALAWAQRVQNAEIWTTEAVLTELGNGLSAYRRDLVAPYIDTYYQTENVHVVPITPELFQRGLDLYRARPDKEWGLTDCLSFVAMRDQNIHHALTGDLHFEQAGFRAVLRSDEA